MIIEVNSRTHGTLSVMIDDEDIKCMNGYKLAVTRIGKKIYPVVSVNRNGKWTKEYLHRLVSGAGKGKIVDHINGDTLDNRKSNLRVCCYTVNALNRNVVKTKTGYANVNKVGNKFRAMIRVHGKPKHLGYFDTAEKANEAVSIVRQDQIKILTGHTG
jgi:hypothetical protein